MRKTWLLIKTQLYGLLDFYGRKQKAKRKRWLMPVALAVLTAFLLAVSFSYSILLAKVFRIYNLMPLLLAIMMVVTCFFILATTIYKVNGILFGFRDYDLLMSLPLTASTVIFSRLALLYLYNLYFCCIVMLPAGIVYALTVAPGFFYYVAFFLTLFFIPLVPVTIASLLGVGVAWLAMHFRHQQLINLIVSFLVFIGVMMGSFLFNNVDFGALAVNLNGYLNRIYPLASWYLRAVIDGSMLSLFWFLFLSAAFSLCFAYGYAKKFKAVNSAFGASFAKSNYKMRSLKTNSPFMALYKKELSQYFHNSVYVLNTSFGLVMYLIFVIASLFVGMEQVMLLLEMPGMVGYLGKYLPLIVNFFIAMSCTTACAISLEGKNLWILQSMPVRAQTILFSKIAVNLTLTLPVIVIGGILFSLSLPLGVSGAVFLFLLPTVYAFFTAWIGMAINLKLPKLDWKSPTAVVKQSAATMLAMLCDLLACALPFLVLYFFPALDSVLFLGGLTAVVAMVTLGLAFYLRRRGEALFKAL